MEKLTKEQETILKNNLDELNEKIIPNTLSKYQQKSLFNTVNEIGSIFEYFVDFQKKYCMKQLLSSVTIHESREVKDFKF